ncbi:hypothetical protein [Streptomyces iconiensis]|uniref:hypothetical protein n=1 Tax=Streptomyces iconiensis TaxID=1384038 RepID=UPI003219DC37
MTDPIRGTRHGCAPAPLSVLDSAMTGTGQSAAEALSATSNSPGSPTGAASPATG